MRYIPVVEEDTPGRFMFVAVASANGVVERFKTQYPVNRSTAFWPSTDEVLKKLIAIGDDGDPRLVDAAIGDRDWTSPHCSGCRNHVDKAVGVSSDVEIYFCERCMIAGLEALRKL